MSDIYGIMSDMIRRINVREFVRNFNREIEDLPVIITKRGEDIAVIQKASQIGQEEKLSDKPPKSDKKEPETVRQVETVDNEVVVEENNHMPFCQYPFCTKRSVGVDKWDRSMCEDHV